MRRLRILCPSGLSSLLLAFGAFVAKGAVFVAVPALGAWLPSKGAIAVRRSALQPCELDLRKCVDASTSWSGAMSLQFVLFMGLTSVTSYEACMA